LGLILFAGCSGIIIDPAGDDRVPLDGGEPDLQSLDCERAYVPDGRLWRLSRAQMIQSFAAAFGVSVSPSDLPSDATYQATGYNNDSASAWVNVQLADRLFDVAEAAAVQVLASQVGADHCVRGSLDATCAAAFVTHYGELAFRRPLEAAELDRYSTFLTSEAAKHGDQVAARMTLQAMMQSPHFLYRTEIGTGEKGQVELSPYELASAISYLVTDAPPSAELLEAAREDRLSDRAEVERITRALLATPEAKHKLRDFFSQYLHLNDLEVSGIEPELIVPLTESVMRFAEEVMFSSSGSMRELFTASYGFVDATTAPLFGVQVSGSGLERVEFPPEERTGIFTHPALLSAKHGAIHRGRAIKEGLLCGTIPAPPPGASDNLSAVAGPDPDATEQQRWATFQEDWPSCAGCHETFQPLGVAFDHYDHHGHYRTANEAGRSIDASSVAVATGLDGQDVTEFGNARELLQRIVDSELGQRCFAKRWLTYASGRELKNKEACSALRAVSDTFIESELDLEELIVATTQDDSFYVRFNQE
jgi:hypothetical protein